MQHFYFHQHEEFTKALALPYDSDYWSSSEDAADYRIVDTHTPSVIQSRQSTFSESDAKEAQRDAEPK